MIEVINLLTTVWQQIFNFMRSWEILPGVSLLTFLITLFIISTVFPLLFTVVHKSTNNSNSEKRKGSDE